MLPSLGPCCRARSNDSNSLPTLTVRNEDQILFHCIAQGDLPAPDPKIGPGLNTPNQHFRPASEDHAITMVGLKPKYDLFDHYRQTATLLLRNRIPRG